MAVAVAFSLFPLIYRAVKIAEHRREKGEKAPMFERSEFGRRTLFSWSAGHRRTAAMGGGFIASASVRRRRFWFLLPRQKGLARAAGESP